MKGLSVFITLVLGLLVGINIQSEYNVTNKKPVIEVRTKIQEKVVEVPVEVIVEKEVIKEVKLIPKVTCTPKIEY